MVPAIVAGTRPEIIKLWPVYLKFKEYNLSPIWVHSGQHDAMALPLYKALGIQPDLLIELPFRGSDLATLGSLLLLRLGEALKEIEPDVVIVQGDTHTALYASLAAFYQQIPIAHVEAGLRTRNLASPFPEEANRQMVARIVKYHFCPTKQAWLDLCTENIYHEVSVVGNTVVDAIKKLADIPPVAKGYILATLHRRENRGEMDQLLTALGTLAKDGYPVVLATHLSFGSKGEIYNVLRRNKNVTLLQPQIYPDFVETICGANVIVTDSGGLQEEAVTLGVPLVVCRDTTERQEAIDCGVGILAGKDPNCIVEITKERYSQGRFYGIENPFGDGKAAERIVMELVRFDAQKTKKSYTHTAI